MTLFSINLNIHLSSSWSVHESEHEENGKMHESCGLLV